MGRLFRSAGQAGFTVMEVLVATAIGLVAITACMAFNVAQMYAMRNQSNQVDLQTNARTIVDLFAREVRRAGTQTNPTCSGSVSTGIVLAKSSRIQIRSVNGLTGSNEDVTYTLDSSNKQVRRTDNIAGRTDTLWSGASIAGSQILYFDSNGSQLLPDEDGLTPAQLTRVMRVKLQLALRANVPQPGNSLQQIANDAADVTVRNRYFVMAGCATPANVPPTPLVSYR